MSALHREKGGDGFIMLKTMEENTVRSYHALRLSTGEKRLLVLRAGYEHQSFEEETRIGPYRFERSTLKWIRNTMKALMTTQEAPLFLDEVGILELHDQGFSDILRKLSKYDKPIYLSIRDTLVQKIIAQYNLENVQIIEGDESNG